MRIALVGVLATVLGCSGAAATVEETAVSSADGGSDADAATEADGAPLPPEQRDSASSADVEPPPVPCSATPVWYRDADGDGYGAAGTAPRSLCGDTTGYVQLAGDCGDEDPAAHPGAPTYSAVAMKGHASGDPFDFNCDGVAEHKYAGVTTCRKTANVCGLTAAAGWNEAEAACGESKLFADTCSASSGGGCVPSGLTRVQVCR